MTEAYSPGLENVVAGETAICTLATGLSYRGYDMEDLTQHSTFDEVAYLILHGDLPTAAALAAFQTRVRAASNLPAEIIETLAKIPAGTPMMDVLRSGVSLLAHWEPEMADNSHAANLRKAERLLGQIPVLMAARVRLLNKLPLIAAQATGSHAANFLWMLRGETPTPRQVTALDLSLIMYAEHEFNASTFAARCICSTLSDLHSSITGAIGTLKGPLHGGANERAMEVLLEIGNESLAAAWLTDALAQKKRIMGFGHRVYKDGDPRAVLLKTVTQEVAHECGQDELEARAEIIEQGILREKNLRPNVDWPCARLYHYLGLPLDLYTPLFVMARITGWSAHVIEQLDNNRLMRPRSIYTGPIDKKWQAISQR